MSTQRVAADSTTTRHVPKTPADLLCFSHLRWDFVLQRPNHLMLRAARDRRVFFIEEPIEAEGEPRLEMREVAPSLFVCVPFLDSRTCGDAEEAQRALVEQLLQRESIVRPTVWFYTPMALPLAEQVQAGAVVYDCMDELSGFLGAPPALLHREKELFGRADLVFTGGISLYEAKRAHHPDVHAFPSSVDVDHFAGARAELEEPADQAHIPRPRVGFYGVIDERLDLDLLAKVAAERPSLQLVVVGPVVKIDPGSLPQAPNLHYLGRKTYGELPGYLAGWDIAMMPFALNASTKFISPTKTLEYLAAQKPVVSTAIRDVVRPYGEGGVVDIADETTFAEALDAALARPRAAHIAKADAVVSATSWDATWAAMDALIARATRQERRARTQSIEASPSASHPASAGLGA